LLQEREQARTRHMLHGQARGSNAALEDHRRREPLKCEGYGHKRRRVLTGLTASCARTICCQAVGHLAEFRQRESGGDAQVTARESPALAPIRSPVPPTAPMASLRLVRRRGSVLAGTGAA